MVFNSINIRRQQIVEAVSDNKSLYLKGVFMEANSRNRNGRIYKKETIIECANKINEAAKNGQAILGELDHPDTLTVSAKNVAIQLVEAEVQGDKLICKAKVERL